MTVKRLDLDSLVSQVALDCTTFVLSLAASVAIGAGDFLRFWAHGHFLAWAVVFLVLRGIANWAFGVYRILWKFVSLPDAITLGKSFLSVTLFLLVVQSFSTVNVVRVISLQIPFVVLVLEFFFSLAGAIAIRAGRKILHERTERTQRGYSSQPQRLALYGAGRAGMLLYKELKGNRNFEVVGFLDDDPRKNGAVILGKEVLGNRENFDQVVRDHRIDQVVISVASGNSRSLSEIMSACKKISIPAKIIPSLQDLVQGRAKIGQLREIQIEDLLGRESVELSHFDERVRPVYEGRSILVTGAGGSIGSELVRQLLLLSPRRVGLMDKDENSLYELEQEILFRFPNAPIEPIVADVRNPNRVRVMLNDLRPEWIFHAAAHKHVPLMEKHPDEAILNNVAGTWTLLENCREFGVERFVFISTDKAVNPTSIMGATKRIGELLVKAYARSRGPGAASVRFGNVAGSRGSVIPVFKKQIAEGGPVTVTDPEMTRFFMTIPEAVQLVLCAGSLGLEGQTFVLDMGNLRSILDLARNMIILSGLKPDKDIQILTTGMRPGEKLFEEIIALSEVLSTTGFERISRIEADVSNSPFSFDDLRHLVNAAGRNDRRALYACLTTFCPEYQPVGRVPAETELKLRQR